MYLINKPETHWHSLKAANKIVTEDDLQSAIAIETFAFPALQNSWSPSLFAPTLTLQKQNNIVILSGAVKSQDFLSEDSLIGVMPPECRPLTTNFQIFPATALAYNEAGEFVLTTDAILVNLSGEIFGSVLNDGNLLQFVALFLDNVIFAAAPDISQAQ